MASSDLRSRAEENIRSLTKISDILKSLVSINDLTIENWKEFIKEYSVQPNPYEKRTQHLDTISSKYFKTKSYIDRFIELDGLNIIINILKNWFLLKSSLLNDFKNYKFISEPKYRGGIDKYPYYHNDSGYGSYGGRIFNIPFIFINQNFGREIEEENRLVFEKSSTPFGNILGNWPDIIGELISKYIDLTDSNPILQHILKPKILKTILEFNKKNYCIFNGILVNCDIKYVLENLQQFSTLKNKILNTNELDEIEEFKEFKIKHQEAEIERELKQQKEQQELQLTILENERKKYNDYFSSFIKPYEDKIKQLENQVTYLRQSIVLISRNNTNITPIEPQVLNDISEDPI